MRWRRRSILRTSLFRRRPSALKFHTRTRTRRSWAGWLRRRRIRMPRGFSLGQRIPLRRGFRAPSWLLPALLGLSGIAVLFFLMLWAVIAWPNWFPARVDGMAVRVSGRELGVVANGKDVTDAVERIRAEYARRTGMTVVMDKPELAPVSVRAAYIAPMEGEQGLIRALEKALTLRVRASVIVIGEQRIAVAALKSVEDARWVLETALTPFKKAAQRRQISDIGFVETVTIEQRDLPFDRVISREDAAKLLLVGGDGKEETYTVKPGDTLWAIAQRNGLRVMDLRIANPAAATTDEIVPEQQLLLTRTRALLHVGYKEQITREEVLEYNTIVKEDSSMLKTQRKVVTSGKSGLREVVTEVSFISGMEVQSRVLSEQVLKAAVDEVVHKGTRALPAGGSQSASVSGFVMPVEGRISSSFGTRWGRLHAGTDFAAPTGTPIYASKSGTVKSSGYRGGYGKCIDISHGDGVLTRYAHCSKLVVKEGQKVKQGELIALVGSTGNSTGPHLHFEIRIDGTPIDPMKKLE